jgi:hypothetical protein
MSSTEGPGATESPDATEGPGATESHGAGGGTLRPAEPVHALNYLPAGSQPPTSGLVSVGSLLNRDLARIVASVLEGEGIECHVFGENTQSLGMHFSGFTEAKLQVPSGDAQRAAAIVRQLVEDPDAVEPAAEEGEAGRAMRGDDGQELVVVGAYDHPRSLQEAAAVLGAARITPYLPRLVSRGANPPGAGNRFPLRAEAEDADRAKSILDDAREEAEEDARERGLLRCPKCNRLTGERISRVWEWLTAFATFRPFPPPRAHCGPCKHYWNTDDA